MATTNVLVIIVSRRVSPFSVPPFKSFVKYQIPPEHEQPHECGVELYVVPFYIYLKSRGPPGPDF